MNILFICGSLENGKDGVGDYTRRLAGELIRQGHDAAIVALNDRHISAVENAEQESDGTKIRVLRLPSVLKNTEKDVLAKQFIEDFNPEWLSLQFVPYSFQKRGLPFGLARRLKKLGEGRKWHIMFHELGGWHCKNSTIRVICKGLVQQFILKHLIATLHSALIHTNIKWRVCRLQNWGISAKLLPLFGNIPVKYGKIEKNSSNLIFIVFGSIYTNENVLGFSKWLSDLQQSENKKIIIYFVGKNGNNLSVWTEILNNQNIEYKILGIQGEDNISKLMSESDVGIITTPYFFAEKSGSAAAMSEHNLPIVCVGAKMIPRKIDLKLYENNFVNWRSDLTLEEILTQKIKPTNLQQIAKELLSKYASN